MAIKGLNFHKTFPENEHFGSHSYHHHTSCTYPISFSFLFIVVSVWFFFSFCQIIYSVQTQYFFLQSLWADVVFLPDLKPSSFNFYVFIVSPYFFILWKSCRGDCFMKQIVYFFPPFFVVKWYLCVLFLHRILSCCINI